MASQGLTTHTSPAQGAKPVVPSDTVDLTPGAARCLYIGTSGDLTVDTVQSDVAVLHKNVPVGWFPLSVVRVRATGTTASNIVAWY